MALNYEQRVELGLEEPIDGEFAPVGEQRPFLPGGHVQMPEVRPNPKLELKVNERATAPRLRSMVNELVAGNMQEADAALKRLMTMNPKEGLKLMVELMAFSMPQLKAMAVQVDDRSEKPGAMTFQQLLQMVQEPPSGS
jgi:hypothetical protein